MTRKVDPWRSNALAKIKALHCVVMSHQQNALSRCKSTAMVQPLRSTTVLLHLSGLLLRTRQCQTTDNGPSP